MRGTVMSCSPKENTSYLAIYIYVYRNTGMHMSLVHVPIYARMSVCAYVYMSRFGDWLYVPIAGFPVFKSFGLKPHGHSSELGSQIPRVMDTAPWTAVIRQAGPHVGVVFRQVGLEFFEVLPAKSFEDLDHLEKDFEREEFRPKFWGPLLGLEAWAGICQSHDGL